MTSVSTAGVPGGVFPRAGRPAPRLGHGMGQVTRSATDDAGRRAAASLLRQAYDLGVRHFDTAESSSHGLANRLLADALGDVRDEVTLATKAGARPVPGALVPLTAAQQPHELREAVEADLTSLRTDQVDVVNLRRMDYRPGSSPRATRSWTCTTSSPSSSRSPTRARSSASVSATSPWTSCGARSRSAWPACRTSTTCSTARGSRCSTPAGTAPSHGVPCFPLGGGGEYAGRPKVVDGLTAQAVADELGATASQVGLAGQPAHAPNTMITTGTSSGRHLQGNVAVGDLVLDPATTARLDGVRVEEHQDGAGA